MLDLTDPLRPAVIGTIPTDYPTQGLAFDRATQTLFAADYLGLNLTFVDTAQGVVSRVVSIESARSIRKGLAR